MFEAITVSSLSKVFPNERPLYPLQSGSCFYNEVYSFQLAFHGDFKRRVRLRVQTEGLSVTVRTVELVPSFMAQNYEFCDDYTIKKGDTSGYYPDLLLPVGEEGISLHPYLWQSVWITVRPQYAGKKKIGLEIYEYENPQTLLAFRTFTLDVLNERLPELDINYTTWFYYDSLADWYKLPLFGEEYEKVMFAFFKNATEHGMNTLLTPIFTPPLCTVKGRYNKTVQLVDVKIEKTRYVFGFSRLKRFMELAQDAGFKFFEMSHLATQWDVSCAPQIVAQEGGETKRIFGWDTPSDGKNYLHFLDEFLPALDKFLTENEWKNKCFFHVADEPVPNGIENYAKVFETLRKNIPDCRIIDATTFKEYADKNLTDIPVVATSHFQNFPVEARKFWVYYCFCQSYDYLSNRNFNMPSQRNRVMGIQLYANKVGGFLHWGFNSYYTSMCERLINPYFETDAGREYASGDPYLVYPAEDKTPFDSLRNEVFFDGIQDYRALKLLETICGEKFVFSLLEQEGVAGFTVYPRDAAWHIRFREKINRLIAEKAEE